MLTEERFERITSLIEMEGSVTVHQLMEELGASESTIRRDLNAMDSNGLLTKVHGGAVSKKMAIHTVDENMTHRQAKNLEAKRRIARYAAKLIEPNDFVYIDAGSTTEMLVEFIENRRAVFVTNALSHAKKLAEMGCQVYILGGMFKTTTEAIVGEEAVSALDKYNFTKGFWGTNGITVSNGFTTPEIKEALVKSKSMENCKKCYVLADPSKFSQISSIKFADFSEATIITTEAPRVFRKYENVVEVRKNDLHSNL